MAAKADEQSALRTLVERELPNFRFVERVTPDSPGPRPVADAATPDLATLRRKYLGHDGPARRTRAKRQSTAASVGSLEAAAAVAAETPDSEIILVEPKNAGPRDRGAGPKAVVISKGKIIGMQG